MNNEKEHKKMMHGYEIYTKYFIRTSSNQHFLKYLADLLYDSIKYQFLHYYFLHVPKWRVLLRSFSKTRTLPDFAMVGPMKSATSDLSNHLLLHPNIMPPLAKEIWSVDPESWRPYYPTLNNKNLTIKNKGTARCGYFTPMMHNTQLIENYHRSVPDAKIIITLRDPVYRAFSHWKWDILHGRKILGTNLIDKMPRYSNFLEYINHSIGYFPNIVESYAGAPMLQTGIYHKSVELWINQFGKDNVLILDASEYFLDRQIVLTRIQEFLNLPHIEIPEYTSKVNENPIVSTPLSDEAASLLSSFYRPYNEKLYELIGKDFGWRNV